VTSRLPELCEDGVQKARVPTGTVLAASRRFFLDVASYASLSCFLVGLCSTTTLPPPHERVVLGSDS